MIVDPSGECNENLLKAIESSRHGKMKMNEILIEHLCIQRVVVVIFNILTFFCSFGEKYGYSLRKQGDLGQKIKSAN